MRILFRLWVIVTVLWVGFFTAIYWNGVAHPSYASFAVGLTLGPPLFLLALGTALAWAFRRY